MSVMLVRHIGVVDVKLAKETIVQGEDKEFKPPESCYHSNYGYPHQRLLSVVS